MLNRMTDNQIEEARRVIAIQASTAPSDGDLSPEGALRRHSGLVGAAGKPVAVKAVTGWPSMMPKPPLRPVGRGK